MSSKTPTTDFALPRSDLGGAFVGKVLVVEHTMATSSHAVPLDGTNPRRV
jgi:hypothetical protein